MSIRLKSRQQCPPGGFVFYQAETNWDSAKAVPASQWDFKLLARSLQAHRKANPRFKLALDLETIQDEIDVANAIRVRMIPRAEGYIVEDTSPFPVPIPKAQGPLSKLAAVAGASGKYFSGGKLFYDWLGDEARPVEAALSTTRAKVCESCPQNEPGDWKSYFTEPVVNAIKRQIEMRNQMKLSTPSDSKLNICGACLCVLHLKVHAPLSHILKNMPKKVKAELDPRCWVLSESK